MADTTFPESGQTGTKQLLRQWMKYAAGALDYVMTAGPAAFGATSFQVSIGTGLQVNVAAGEAFANGVYFKRDVSTTGAGGTLSANSTIYIFVGYVDGTSNAVQFTTGATATPPSANYILLAKVVTGASTVSSVTDQRNTVAISGWGAP